jgi:hypothetical protein
MSAFLFGVPGKLKTLIDRLTSTRAGYLDNLAQYTTTRAGYLDRLNSYLDASVAGRLGSIKTIRYGTITISTYNYNRQSATDTFTAVDTAKAVLIPLGMTVGGTASANAACSYRITLTNSTTVTVNVTISDGSGPPTTTVQYLLVEFN